MLSFKPDQTIKRIRQRTNADQRENMTNSTQLLSMLAGSSGIDANLLLESDEFEALFKTCVKYSTTFDEAYSILMDWIEANF